MEFWLIKRKCRDGTTHFMGNMNETGQPGYVWQTRKDAELWIAEQNAIEFPASEMEVVNIRNVLKGENSGKKWTYDVGDCRYYFMDELHIGPLDMELVNLAYRVEQKKENGEWQAIKTTVPPTQSPTTAISRRDMFAANAMAAFMRGGYLKDVFQDDIVRRAFAMADLMEDVAEASKR